MNARKKIKPVTQVFMRETSSPITAVKSPKQGQETRTKVKIETFNHGSEKWDD